MQIHIYRARYSEDSGVRVFAHLYDSNGKLLLTALLGEGENPRDALVRTLQTQLVTASVIDDGDIDVLL